MAQNPERRAALVNAAIEVLAREGARGLTFRAVDVEASVPKGTASNYFASRDDLFDQVGKRIHERMGPDPSVVEESGRKPQNLELAIEYMQGLFGRITRDRTGYLALQELRLEAVRRPELRTTLTRTISENLERDIGFHLESGLPGDRSTVLMLYLAMNALIVEHLTLPGVLDGVDTERLVADLVTRAVATPDARVRNRPRTPGPTAS
ncbi:TetR/AcrR family transcriptional regulator [Rhodococcus sp. ACPA1]|uniref:TetR/AcrR family transcriptional regulator n=2 Tax=unclassified Rhodococcus (in: high G+C Gram-positive bacteria) TaxID=192944 RepID=UPI000BB0FA64|nr:TetR/AcrR family transcriptional regulator [Rhodococcus sp. ACPA1]PBC55088.1 TetR family transcriptional regulator [Rhodococcus sp. ACPA1]